MDVKEFVSSSLLQIIEAVELCQQELLERGSKAEINPNDVEGQPRKSHLVDFDMSVTVTDEGEMKAGGKLKILSIGAEGGVSSSNQNELVHRLKFAVPLALPFSEITAEVISKIGREREAKMKRMQKNKPHDPLNYERI